MNKKRYAIVRVECPPRNEIDAQFVCFPNDNNCSGCRYGDTKKQMILKVAQVLFRRRLDLYKLIWGGVPSKTEAERYYEVRLEIAKEIVEFLGVEE